MVRIVKQNFDKNKEIYQKIKNQLECEIDEDIIINHVGSTAIPNIYGKNIIDILIGVENLDCFEKVAKRLTIIGYFPSNKSKTEEYQFFASRKEETVSGDIHIHLVKLYTDRYNDFILLKKYLLNNPLVAKEYSNYKKEILKLKGKDREIYKKEKSDFVSNLIKQARKMDY